MANDSSRTWRGWVYAIFFALFIGGAIFYSHHAQRFLGLNANPQVRTTKHQIQPRFQRNFATEEAALAFHESLELDESRRWTEFRRQPALSLQASVEPTMKAQLLAPQIASTIGDKPSQQDDANRNDNSKYQLTSTTNKIAGSPPHYVSTPSLTTKVVSTNAWPMPSALMQALDTLIVDSKLEQATEVTEWAVQLQENLEELTRLQSMRDPQSVVAFEELKKSASEILENPSSIPPVNPELAKKQYLTAHAVLRRVSVWHAIWNCTSGEIDSLPTASVSSTIDFNALQADLLQARRAIARTGDVTGWNRFLMLDDLQQLTQDDKANAQQASDAARNFLARIEWDRVSPAQQALIADEAIQKLATRLSPLAWSPVDYRQMLVNIETMESDSIHRCRSHVAEDVQTLRYMAQPAQLKLAETVNTFYRNANLRIAVSKELLDRGLPKAQMMDRPVRQRILGADTRGASQVQTSMNIELVPDPQAWNLVLRLNGDVQSKTHSSRGPATFYNDSIAKVDSARRLRVDTKGIHMSGEQANVSANDQLRGFDTDFDSLPIVGDLLRYVVRQQFDSQRGVAQRIVKRTIAEQTDTEFDRQLSTQLKSAETNFQSKILGPLDRLELNPLIVNLETTPTRLIARYRMAGGDQMAAHTPRPLAPSDSLASVQIHESAINNAIDKLGLSGRTWTLPQLGEQLAEVLGQADWKFPEDTPKDVTIRFAETRPITIEFTDGAMNLTLRVEELQQAEQSPLRDFIIRTQFTPQSVGLESSFVHTGVISVDGRRLGMRERLPLRAIFGRIFAGRSTIPIVAPTLAQDSRAAGLAVSQQEIRDGWLAIAISPANSPHVSAIQGTVRR